MKIKDIMTDQLACVKPESTVTEAAQMMQKHDVGVIPVCEGEKVIGILTDRDIVVRNIAHGNNSLISTMTALKSAEYAITETGFGADLGFEKFCHIPAQIAGLEPSLALLVVSTKALMVQGGLRFSQSRLFPARQRPGRNTGV